MSRTKTTRRARKSGGKYVQTCLNVAEYARFRENARPEESDGELARRLLFEKMGLPEEGLDPSLGDPVTAVESASS